MLAAAVGLVFAGAGAYVGFVRDLDGMDGVNDAG
jgi:hypothetical protein